MSSHGKLSLRPLPHLDFVLGWPGVPGSSSKSRNPAHLAGNVEVRLGSKGMKAKWLRIELRKIETVPGGENWGELIGRGPIDVWSARAEEEKDGSKANGDREVDADGSVWQILRTADFPFRINIPEALPPTAKLDKVCGIQYEIVSSLCVKTKKGLLRKEDTSSIIQSVHPITLDKHELHSAWPAYNQPDTHTGERDQMRAKLRRDRYCYAPGDKVKVKVIVSSNRVEPAKLKSVAVTVKETVTFHGVKPSRKSVTSNSSGAQPSMQRTEVITQKAKQVGKKLYKGDSMDFDLELIIPKSHALMTISTAKHVEVSYTMRLYCDTGKTPIIIDHIPMMMTTFPRQTSLAMIKKIGFVEGLSERELVIDDDVDDASTLQGVSRSVRPAPARSLSYNGSTSTASAAGYDQTFLNRRDTVMTHATGGMAGRGVPGMIFSYSTDGFPAPTSSPFHVADGPRPAFAGPDVSYDEEGNRLSAMEQTALYHHSNNPTNAMAVGVNYEDITALEPTRSHFVPVRGSSPHVAANQRFSFAGFPNNTSNGDISQPIASEQEKERLFDRARQQAERNQRRADEHRAALMSTNYSSSSLDHASNSVQRPMSVDGASRLPVSEQEKLRLWERARREAEMYQRGFNGGAAFPPESRAGNNSNAPSRMHTPALPTLNETQAFQNPYDDDHDRREEQEQRQQRNIPVVATTYPSYESAEQEKARLYNQAKAQTEAQSNRTSYVSSELTPSTSNNSNALDQSSSTAHSTVPSEKEQMKRYYEAQDAVRQGQQRVEASKGISSSSSSSSVPLTEKRLSGGHALQSSLETTKVLTEKEQLARYYAAQEEVQKHQALQASGSEVHTANVAGSATVATSANISGAQSEKQQLARYNAAQEEVRQRQMNAHSTSSTQPTTVPSAMASASTAMTEKEQMRRYLEARDREVQSGTDATGSAAPTMVSPRPMYAPNFHAMPTTPTTDTDNRTFAATTPLPQGQFPSILQTTGSNNSNAKPRVVSFTPPSAYSQRQQEQQLGSLPSQPQQRTSYVGPSPHSTSSAQPGLGVPNLQNLSLNYRGGTPNPLEGPWAPKVATPAWYDDTNGHSSNTSTSVPPPIPPKTALRP